MTTKPPISWQQIRDQARANIHSRHWKPGDTIPTEADLAKQFGCARATVNRALRALAEEGFLDRKRKAGTIVAHRPKARAVVTIPIIREEIEAQGKTYHYRLLPSPKRRPSAAITKMMGQANLKLLRKVRALHFADGQPFVLEDRWINLETVPHGATADFNAISANEWLLSEAPFTHGQIDWSAANASASEAKWLNCAKGAALFITERLTWDRTRTVTHVRLSFAPTYRMGAKL